MKEKEAEIKHERVREGDIKHERVREGERCKKCKKRSEGER